MDAVILIGKIADAEMQGCSCAYGHDAEEIQRQPPRCLEAERSLRAVTGDHYAVDFRADRQNPVLDLPQGFPRGPEKVVALAELAVGSRLDIRARISGTEEAYLCKRNCRRRTGRV